MNSCIRPAIVRKTMLMMAFIPAMLILLSGGFTASANTDTTWSVSFRLNMTKAVKQHIFRPDTDYVYVIMDHGIQPFRLVPGPGYTYTGTLFDELDSGTTYNFKFRINENNWETVNRKITAQPGIASYSAWWNDDPINVTSFTVNMEYAVQKGRFNPVSDTVCIVGTMNDMKGSPRMQQIGTSFHYSITYGLDPGTIHQYKYRINADPSGFELLNKPDRIIRVPDTLLDLINDFDNYNPAKRLMTFECNMGYYITAKHFNPDVDFLIVQGTFNNWKGNDVLFDMDSDSIYKLDQFFDTTWFSQGPFEFNFDINNDGQTPELMGKPHRFYQLHDTINQNLNVYTCFYNNLDPSIPTPPWAYDVEIQGNLVHKKFLSGSYSYENVNGIREGISIYRWLRSSNEEGTDTIAIDSATKLTYTIDTLDIGKWLVFEVTPVAASGDSAKGKPLQVVSSESVEAWDVGIGEHQGLISLVYPNPASDLITIVARKEIERVELSNQMGQIVLMTDGLNTSAVRFSIRRLIPGIYFLRAFTASKETGSIKLIKL